MISTISLSTEKKYSLEEYLELENQAKHKSEYEAGNIYSMAGGTLNHSAITSNFNYALQKALRDKKSKCRVFESNLKVRVETYDSAVYPDNLVLEVVRNLVSGEKPPLSCLPAGRFDDTLLKNWSCSPTILLIFRLPEVNSG